MDNKELVQKLREHLADKEGIDGKAAPALHLMRHALLALERPAVTEVRQEVLEDTATADLLEEREGFIYGLLGELQLIPEVDGEPVETLADAIAADYEILESLHSEVVNLFTRWNESPDTARDRDVFIGAVCNLLQLNGGTPLRDVWSALEAKATYLNSLVRGIAERDDTIAALELGKMVEGTDADDLIGPAPDVSATWADEALDLAHAVVKDKSRGNRVMAKAAAMLINDAKGIPLNG